MKRTKKLVSLVMAFALSFGLIGCSFVIGPPTTEQSATRTFTDSLGRTVEIPDKITRVAVTGPLTQIVVFAFSPELLVGWSSDWSEEATEFIPDEYLNLPTLGQLYGGKGELNLEELLSVSPDVVIDIGEPKGNIKEDMDALSEQTGIPFVHITAMTDTMGDAFRKLGELTGFEERAEEYAEYCDKTLERTKNIMSQVGDDKVRVLYCLGDSGCNVIAKDSYHAEVIDLLTDNLAVVEEPSSKGSGNEVDMEQILTWNPDFVIFAPDSIYDNVGADSTWQEVEAIKEGNYVEVPFGPYNWMGFPPSVQRYLGMMWLPTVLYPDKCDFDLKTEVVKYYNMFYHYDLTDEQYDALMINSLK